MTSTNATTSIEACETLNASDPLGYVYAQTFWGRSGGTRGEMSRTTRRYIANRHAVIRANAISRRGCVR